MLTQRGRIGNTAGIRPAGGMASPVVSLESVVETPWMTGTEGGGTVLTTSVYTRTDAVITTTTDVDPQTGIRVVATLLLTTRADR